MKHYAQNDVRITDVTLMSIPNIKQKAAVEFCGRTIEAGVSFVEMPPVTYRRLEGRVNPESVSLRISSYDEYVFYKGRGVCAFSADLTAFISFGLEKAIPGLTVILPEKEKLDGCARKYCHSGMAFRLQGLDDVMLNDYRSEFSSLLGACPQLCLDPYDTRFTASAAALEFIHAGGTAVCTSFCGCGGHASTEQMLAALNVTAGAAYNLTGLPLLRASYEALTEKTVPFCSPVSGSGIFFYESGIHADGIGKNPATYEPFEPHSVGLRRTLTVGKHSGRTAIRIKLRDMGFFPGDRLIDSINHEVHTLSEKNGRGLYDEEFLTLYKTLSGGIEGG